MEVLHEVVQIRVDESRLITNLASVFSNNTKVIAELMQNARRAGASRIDIKQQDDTIIVSDNGHGISSFTNLLTLAQSGWDEGIMESESPYGMGFFSTLFAAKKVIVRSNSKQIIVHCDEDFLAQKIDVTNSTVTSGTEVHLLGCKIEDLESVLKEYCAGFPIDVYFNESSDPVPSPHRINGNFKDFGAGKIRGDINKFKGPSNHFNATSYIAYLQGFVVCANYGNRYWFQKEDATVIHLDGLLFHARMPDRDCLINKEEEEFRIFQALKAYRKTEILQLKESNPNMLFDYYDVIKSLQYLEVFNDIDYLPKSFFGKLTLPIKSSDAHSCYVEPFKVDDTLTRDEVSSGLFLKGDPSRISNEDHPYVMALLMTLYKSKATILDKVLDANHWVYRFTKEIPDLTDYEYVNDKESEIPVLVSYPKPIKSGRWGYVDVHMVEFYELSVPELGISVKLDSELGLALGCDESGDFAPGVLLMPMNSNADVLDQTSDWMSNDDYDERWQRDEKNSLNAFLRVLRGQDYHAVLRDLLNDTDQIIRKALAGNSFLVSFHDDGGVVVSKGDAQ